MEKIIKEFNIYKFDELSKTAQSYAIDTKRELLYKDEDIYIWVLDDCYLLEPPHKELEELYKKNKLEYKDLLIKNTRKIYYSLDRNRFIDISNAMEIQNNYMFLKWLGLNNRLIEKVTFEIGKDTINIEPNYYKDCNITKIEQIKIDLAVDKFEQHCENILTQIEEYIEYRYTHESILEDINSEDNNYLESGKIYN